MRKLIVAVLLASAAGPAFAADRAADRRAEARAERAERAEARAERSRATREERQQARQERAQQTVESRRERVDARRQVQAPARVNVQAPAQVQGDSVRNWRGRDRQRVNSPTAIQERNLRQGRLADRQAERQAARDARRVSRTPAPGTQPPPPPTATAAQAQPTRHWRGDWRSDRRYNWSDHRRRHRSIFRLGFYLDPFGWGYNRHHIGWRMWPSYYSSRYWLNDPWMYRLPPAYGPYRWVRYYDDALLVNIYSGEVVDVIYSFFW